MTDLYKAVFAHHFHIRPWELALLTARDFDNLVDAYERYVAESEEAARG